MAFGRGVSLESWFSAPWKEETIHGGLRTDRRSGQDPALGQVQVNREKRSKRKGGRSREGRIQSGGSGQLCPLLLASRPRVTSGASHIVVSTDLGKGQWSGWSGSEITDCSGLSRSQEERGQGETTLMMECPRRQSDKPG